MLFVHLLQPFECVWVCVCVVKRPALLLLCGGFSTVQSLFTMMKMMIMMTSSIITISLMFFKQHEYIFIKKNVSPLLFLFAATPSLTNFCYTYRRQTGMRNDGSYFWRGFVRSLLACAVRCETSRPRCDAFQVKKDLAAWDCFLFQLPSKYSLTPDMKFGFYLHCHV